MWIRTFSISSASQPQVSKEPRDSVSKRTGKIPAQDLIVLPTSRNRDRVNALATFYGSGPIHALLVAEWSTSGDVFEKRANCPCSVIASSGGNPPADLVVVVFRRISSREMLPRASVSRGHDLFWSITVDIG